MEAIIFKQLYSAQFLTETTPRTKIDADIQDSDDDIFNYVSIKYFLMSYFRDNKNAPMYFQLMRPIGRITKCRSEILAVTRSLQMQ